MFRALFRILCLTFLASSVLGYCEEVRVSLHNHLGALTLHIDGEPVFGLILHRGQEPEAVKQVPRELLGKYRIYNLEQYPGGHKLSSKWDTWTGPGEYDYSLIDQRFTDILAFDPDAWFTVWVNIFTPSWWDEQNLGEMIVFDDGVRRRRVRGRRSGKDTQGAWASPVWRAAAGGALKAYLRHIREQPWGERVLLYRLGGSFSTEWYWPGSVEGWLPDYSEPNRRAFRSWLGKKYGTVERLRVAWGNRDVTFETAEIPTRLQRTDGLTAHRQLGLRGRTPHWLWLANPNIFRESPRDRQVIDFSRYNSEIVVDTINYFARIAAEETGGSKLIGAPYGYGHLRGGAYPQFMGKNAQGLMLESPWVRFQTSPPLSSWTLSGPVRKQGLSIDSMRLHGQKYIIEIDNALQGDFARDVQRMRRELHRALLSGSMAYMPVTLKPGLTREYSIPELCRELAPTWRILNESVHYRRESVSEVAILGDEESLDYLNLDSLYKLGSVYDHALRMASVAGVPYDFYLLADAARDDFPAYKLYLVVNAWKLSDSQRAALRRKLQRNGSVVVWLYAPGYLNGEGRPDVAAMSQLTGIRLVRDKLAPTLEEAFGSRLRLHEGGARSEAFRTRELGIGPTYITSLTPSNPLLVRITDTDHPITAALTQGAEFGPEVNVGPRFTVVDREATVLGQYKEGGQPALAVKDLGSWRSVYAGTPVLTPELIRGLAKYAGVPVFMDSGDVLYANSSYIAVTCLREGGTKRITLPRSAVLYDLYAERALGPRGKRFEVKMTPKTTYLFYWGERPYGSGEGHVASHQASVGKAPGSRSVLSND